MVGQFEESEEVDVLKRQFVLVRHKRQKYRCACGSCIETALGPKKLGMAFRGNLHKISDADYQQIERLLQAEVPA